MAKGAVGDKQGFAAYRRRLIRLSPQPEKFTRSGGAAPVL